MHSLRNIWSFCDAKNTFCVSNRSVYAKYAEPALNDIAQIINNNPVRDDPFPIWTTEKKMSLADLSEVWK